MSREDNKAFVRERIAFYEKNPSELGIRAGVLLALWCEGWHHVPNPASVNWADPKCITIAIHRPLATVDARDLTTLVFLAHDEALRVEVAPPNMPDPEEEPTGEEGGGLILRISGRQREGEFWEKCPTLEQALLKHRCSFAESGVAA